LSISTVFGLLSCSCRLAYQFQNGICLCPRVQNVKLAGSAAIKRLELSDECAAFSSIFRSIGEIICN
jgi:hypothetical protein